MKKVAMVIGLIILISSISLGASGSGEKIKIVATLQIFSTIAKDIGRNNVNVDYIVPQGADIHDYSLTHDDIQKIQSADLIILTDSEFFSIDKNIKDYATNKKILDFEDYNATLFTLRNFGKDVHGYWLDPENAIKIGRAIKEELVSMDSKNSEYYENNFKSFKSGIKNTENYMQNMVNSFDLKNKTALLAVPGVFYVVKSLNISSWGSIVKGPNQFISPQEMNSIEREIKEGKIDFIVNAYGLENSKAGEIAIEISKETGVKILYVDIFSCNNYTNLLIKNAAIISSYSYSKSYQNENCDYTSYVLIISLLSILTAAIFYIAYRYRKELLKEV